MITLETPTGLVELARETERIAPAASRSARVTQAGELILDGDGGWDPTGLTITLRASDTTPDGVARLQELQAAAETATALHRPGHKVTYLRGLLRAKPTPRGTWWRLELSWLPRLLVGGDGTGELCTIDGQPATIDGIQTHIDEGST